MSKPVGRVERVFKFIAFELEGKDAPDQPTVYGITQHWYPKFYNRIKSILDNNADPKLLEAAVVDAYSYIYQHSKAYRMYYPLDVWYLDYVIHSGVDDAVWVLQECLDYLGYKCTVDGVWGKQTEGMFERFMKEHSSSERVLFVDIYRLFRRWHYTHRHPFKYRCAFVNRTLRLEMFLLTGATRIPVKRKRGET